MAAAPNSLPFIARITPRNRLRVGRTLTMDTKTETFLKDPDMVNLPDANRWL